MKLGGNDIIYKVVVVKLDWLLFNLKCILNYFLAFFEDEEYFGLGGLFSRSFISFSNVRIASLRLTSLRRSPDNA